MGRCKKPVSLAGYCVQPPFLRGLQFVCRVINRGREGGRDSEARARQDGLDSPGAIDAEARLQWCYVFYSKFGAEDYFRDSGSSIMQWGPLCIANISA